MRLRLILILAMGLTQPAHGATLEEAPGLSTGSVAPDFTASTHEGNTLTLSDVVTRGPVVLVFYRGAWCPYCNLHLKQFQSKLDEFKSLDATVIGISVDLTDYAKKTVVQNGLGFDVLSDPNAEILSQYNLLYEVPADLAKTYKNEYGIDLEKHSGRTDHVIAIPATFVINLNRKVIFADASTDYKVRTSPEEVLSVLRSLQQSPVADPIL